MPAEDANTEAIGIVAAKMMEKIESDFPNGVKVGDAIIIVEVECPVPPDGFDWDQHNVEGADVHELVKDWERSSVIDYYSNNDKPFVQQGLLQFGIDTIKGDYSLLLADPFGEDEDPEDDD